MFHELRHKLSVYDAYINPFTRRGALRLWQYHPRFYLLLTTLAAASGYLFLFLFPLLLVTMPVALYFTLPVASGPLSWFLVSIEFMLLLAGAGVSFAIATMRFSPPSGLELKQREFPRLFELLDELGETYGYPRIDRVIMRDRFDVRMVKTPCNGFPFRTTHTLVIGLPVLLTLSPIDAHVLIARRVGQLAGKQHRVSSWMYYLRDMWCQYLANCGQSDSLLIKPLCMFFGWYVPMYRTVSLGVARSSEMQADVDAMQSINDRDAARGITAQVLIEDYLARVFWPEVLENARSSVRPDMLPHARMAQLFEGGLPADTLKSLLTHQERRRSSPKSAVPCLARRMDNMGHRKALLPKPLSVSAARFYLGGAYRNCIEIIDKRSSQKVRSRVIRDAGSEAA